MDNKKYFEDLFESIPDYRDVVLLMFLIKNDVDLLQEGGFSKMILSVLAYSLKFCY